ncbi:rhodanese-like domain-containing protein [Enterococcus saccharolyticus]|uniref:Rhodanese domain-containing protein n=1 Tax=Enterococcus saccharolyticus subsp. saccharolyticus ATCC 43076 TaxID=1139996 RepID=S0NX27_9ENTE|nr:rhodanese-like domain-containing protein [Enterococcus saccharolyticus]EOT29260.1 hypothetical protein OMQ_01212 [Enterococcus saccharolyticus subsp. saccharolyticus ATCC 43076]EOT81058.1 hypothetical protein I572_01590 [Enterococcus saccharolyticus subsp. saccharolyticus ATCC 43076]
MYNSIGMAEFEQIIKQKQVSVLDVREAEEFQNGHLPQAVNYPLSELGINEQTLPKQEKHYVLCQAGARSERACQLLSSQGYQVINVMGGMSAWRGAIE